MQRTGVLLLCAALVLVKIAAAQESSKFIGKTGLYSFASMKRIAHGQDRNGRESCPGSMSFSLRALHICIYLSISEQACDKRLSRRVYTPSRRVKFPSVVSDEFAASLRYDRLMF